MMLMSLWYFVSFNPWSSMLEKDHEDENQTLEVTWPHRWAENWLKLSCQTMMWREAKQHQPKQYYSTRYTMCAVGSQPFPRVSNYYQNSFELRKQCGFSFFFLILAALSLHNNLVTSSELPTSTRYFCKCDLSGYPIFLPTS